MPPFLTAVTSSSRQLLLLLRCISFAKKAQVRISTDGIRITTEEGSIMEAFVILEKALFTTYTYNPPPPTSTQDSTTSPPPTFQISMPALLEILNIFTLSDPLTSKRPNFDNTTPYDSFAAHRLARHAGQLNAFSPHALGLSGTCTLTYDSPGSALEIHMREKDVTTTCELTTYDADGTEEIPFARDQLALKTIMRASVLLDAVTELTSLNPSELVLRAQPSNINSKPNLLLSATGSLGSSTISFTTSTASETPVLETFHCPAPVSASFKFSLIKAAQRAMQAATKVSLRLDREGVLSLQFLVEVGEGGGGGGGGAAGAEAVTFVDFRVVPLMEEGDGDEGNGSEDSD